MAIPCLNAKLYAVSDIHTDHGTNSSWVESVHPTRFQSDALIVAGDVANDLTSVEKSLRGLKAKFSQVFYVPGNHDLWTKSGSDGESADSSIARVDALERLCKSIGVETQPCTVADRVLVCPLLSWYERTTQSEDLPQGYTEDHLQGWMDFWKCDWTGIRGAGGGKSVQDKLREASAVNSWMLSRNEERLATLSALRASKRLPVVTFSHFVPRTDLLPAMDKLKFKELVDVSISESLDIQIREAGTSLHVFGHTHIPCNREIDGVRYVQQPLGYPGEPWIRKDQKDIARMVVWPPPT